MSRVSPTQSELHAAWLSTRIIRRLGRLLGTSGFLLLLLCLLSVWWIFRTGYGPLGEARVEYRVMNCHFDPVVEPPPEIFALPGTKVHRAH